MRLNVKRHLVLLRSLVIGMVMSVACGNVMGESVKSEGRRLELSGRTMGTTWSAVVHLKKSESSATSSSVAEQRIEDAIQKCLNAYESVTSNYQRDSTLSRINRASHSELIDIPDVIYHNLKVAQRVHGETGGLYDITIGPLVEAYGFGPGSSGVLRAPPSDEQVRVLLSQVGMAHLDILPGTNGSRRGGQASMRKKVPNLQLDLSSLAKGAAVDYTIERLSERYAEVASMMLEVGGEIKTYNRAFVIGIEKPIRVVGGGRETGRDDEIEIKIKLPGDYAIATSGSYKQFHADPDNAGQGYSHLINPRTGKPIRSMMRAVSVVHRNAIEADAYATALMIMSPKQAWAFAQHHELAVRMTYEVRPEELMTLSTKKFPSAIVVSDN